MNTPQNVLVHANPHEQNRSAISYGFGLQNRFVSARKWLVRIRTNKNGDVGRRMVLGRFPMPIFVRIKKKPKGQFLLITSNGDRDDVAGNSARGKRRGKFMDALPRSLASAELLERTMYYCLFSLNKIPL